MHERCAVLRLVRWLVRRTGKKSAEQASLLQYLHDNPPDFTSEAAKKYHGDNRHGR